MGLALITGATSGIGRATAEKLAQAKWDLWLVGRREARLNELQSHLEKNFGVAVRTAVLDVTDGETVAAFVKSHEDILGALDVLVNNAGLALGTDKIQDGRIEDWERMIDTNVKGLLYMTRHLLPFFLKKQKGHIVNIGSVSGRWVYPGGGVYCSTKFAVRAISEGLRMDLNGTPIRVTNIEPGMVETEFSLVRLGSKAAADQVYTGMQPLMAQDIAECVEWSLSRPARVNIQEMVVFPVDQAGVGLVHRKD